MYLEITDTGGKFIKTFCCWIKESGTYVCRIVDPISHHANHYSRNSRCLRFERITLQYIRSKFHVSGFGFNFFPLSSFWPRSIKQPVTILACWNETNFNRNNIARSWPNWIILRGFGKTKLVSGTLFKKNACSSWKLIHMIPSAINLLEDLKDSYNLANTNR